MLWPTTVKSNVLRKHFSLSLKQIPLPPTSFSSESIHESRKEKGNYEFPLLGARQAANSPLHAVSCGMWFYRFQYLFFCYVSIYTDEMRISPPGNKAVRVINTV